MFSDQTQTVSHGSQGQHLSFPTEVARWRREQRGVADLSPRPPALLQCSLQGHPDRDILRERTPSHPYQTLPGAYGEIIADLSLSLEEG